MSFSFCAIYCTLSVNHQGRAFLLDFFLHGNFLFRLMGMKKAASFN